MDPKFNTASLQETFIAALCIGGADALTRATKSAIESGRSQKEVASAMALAQFAFDERIEEETAAAMAAEPQAEALTLTKAADVQPRDVDWLWPQWLPRGELTLLAGQPKTGKTTLALSIASILSRGGKWPTGERAKKADTIFWTAEDSIEKTIVPRLKAAGADLQRIRFINYGKRIAFSPSQHMTVLQETIKDDPQAGLLILDPVISVLQGVRDSHRATDVRQGLADLQTMIGQLDLAVIGITHFAKSTRGGDPLERMIGSQVWGAAARVVWAAARDADSGARTLVQVKNNLAAEAGAFDYSIEVPDGHKVTAALWGASSRLSAEEVLQMAERGPRDSEEASALDEAKDFFTDLLDGMGWLSSGKIDAALKENHIKVATFRRARTALKSKGEVECRRYHGKFEWRIPGQEENHEAIH